MILLIQGAILLLLFGSLKGSVQVVGLIGICLVLNPWVWAFIVASLSTRDDT